MRNLYFLLLCHMLFHINHGHHGEIIFSKTARIPRAENVSRGFMIYDVILAKANQTVTVVHLQHKNCNQTSNSFLSAIVSMLSFVGDNSNSRLLVPKCLASGHIRRVTATGDIRVATFCPSEAVHARMQVDVAGDVGTEFVLQVLAESSQVSLNSLRQILLEEPDDISPNTLQSSLDIFFFDLSVVDMSKQVQVTVRSDSSDVAQLVVANSCPSTLRQNGGLVPSSSNASLIHLIFTKFGSIVLSKSSKPNLQPGTWFIGIRLVEDFSSLISAKNYSTNGDAIIAKNVTVEITQDHGYETGPVAAAVFISLGGGGVIAFLFFNITFLKSYATVARLAVLAWNRLFVDWLHVVANWFWRGRKTYAYLVPIIGLTLFVAGLQVVYPSWLNMIDSGNRDICFYNEGCYVASASFDLPINSIASNIVYVIHGFLIMIYFSLNEAYCFRNGHYRFYDYSHAYAMAWALAFEGLFSSIYHICPTRMLFQFDTAFMFVISILMVTSIYHGRAVRPEDILLSERGMEHWGKQKSLRAPKVFLSVLGPLLVFNYLGSLKNVDGLGTTTEVFFIITEFAWISCILLWGAYKIDILHVLPKPIYFGTGMTPFNEIVDEGTNDVDARNGKASSSKTYVMRIKRVVYVIFSLTIISILIFVFRLNLDFAESYLLICILSGLGATVMGEVLNIRDRKRNNFPHYRLEILLGLVLYLLIAVLWGIALYYFIVLDVSNKSDKPWESRARNKPCIFLNYFGDHSIWHICSSFALFLTVMRVVVLSKPCKKCSQEFREEYRRVNDVPASATFFSVELTTVTTSETAGSTTEGIINGSVTPPR